MKPHRLGLLILVAAAAACAEQSTTPLGVRDFSSAATAVVAPQGDYVITPSGWYHRSCVHEIPHGARVAIGGLVTRADRSTFAIPRCLYPSYRTIPPNALGGINPPDATNLHWMEYSYDTLLAPSRYFQLDARWAVPAAPLGAYGAGATYFAFPGLTSTEHFISQPVIQYGSNGGFGGSYWTMASWQCDTNPCLHSPPVRIAAGDSIRGQIWPYECVNSVCYWGVSSYDMTSHQITSFDVQGTQHYWWSNGGAVEVYGLTSCSQYPTTGVFFNTIALHDANGTLLSPAWQNRTRTAEPGISPACSFSVTSTSTVVNVYHNPPPPPPPPSIWVTISGPSTVPQGISCTFIGSASNGTDPYTFDVSPASESG